ncbi:MAG: hypothetical protein ACPG43_12400 [Alcanivoracaceae bacterium]
MAFAILIIVTAGLIAVPWTAVQWRHYGRQTGESTYYLMRGLLYPLYWPAMVAILAGSRFVSSREVSGLTALLLIYIATIPVSLMLDGDLLVYAELYLLPAAGIASGFVFLLYFQLLVNRTCESTDA